MAYTFQAIRDGSVIIEACNQLENRVARQVMRTALREVMRPTLADAKSLAPVDTGALAASLGLRAIARTRRGIGVLIQTTGALKKSSQKRGLRTFGGDEFYGSFVEFGHRFAAGKRATNTMFGGRRGARRSERIRLAAQNYEASRTRGQFPGIPFLKEAGDMNRDRMTRELIDRVNEGIEKAIAANKI